MITDNIKDYYPYNESIVITNRYTTNLSLSQTVTQRIYRYHRPLHNKQFAVTLGIAEKNHDFPAQPV